MLAFAVVSLAACLQRMLTVFQKLQEKYTGYSGKSRLRWVNLFLEGSSTLIFDKKIIKITNKTEDHTEPFVVIPEDKLDGEAKGAFNKHKSEYKGDYFILLLVRNMIKIFNKICSCFKRWR